MEKQKFDVNMITRVSKEMAEEFKKIVIAKCTNASQAMREAISDYIQKNSQNN